MPDLLTSPILPCLVMLAGMMPALERPGLIRPGQFGPDDPGGAALGVRPEVGRVVHRDALGDDDGEPDLGVDGLDDGGLGERRRHEDDADVGAGLLHGLGDAAEDRDAGAVEVDARAGLAAG